LGNAYVRRMGLIYVTHVRSDTVLELTIPNLLLGCVGLAYYGSPRGPECSSNR